jgi:hypothetical protein
MTDALFEDIGMDQGTERSKDLPSYCAPASPLTRLLWGV